MGAGRPPKCKICGATLNAETAYMVVTQNKNGNKKKAFYCSKEELAEYLKTPKAKCTKKKEAAENKQPTDRDIAYRLVCEIIGRKTIINTILWKEWKVWNSVAPDEIIKKYLIENREYLIGVIAKLDNVEYNRIRYLSAILKNNLGDFKPKQEAFIPQIQTEYYETKFKPKARVALLDIEEECYE